MKSIQEIKSNFEQILSDVIKIQGLPVESATQVAAVILQESGKFERTEMLNNNRNGNRVNSNGNDKPATEKQKKFLQDLGIAVTPNMTSREASRLIESSNGKGRASAPSFPK